MYCKDCGKEIANDSKFCQHCGTKQDIIFNQSSMLNNSKIKIPKWINRYYPFYLLWVFINFMCLINYNKRNGARDWLFPFATTDLRYYDFSEFIIYTIILPLVIFSIFKIYMKSIITK